MNKENNLNLQCPVCHMMVNKGNFFLDYQQRRFLFCSQQCLQRFKSNPHLYIGRPVVPAPAQQGHQIIKMRKIKTGRLLTDVQCYVIESEIKQMMGIRFIQVEPGYISITYDLMQVTVEQIETAIEDTGNKLDKKLGESLKHVFMNYVEETELVNLEDSGNIHKH